MPLKYFKSILNAFDPTKVTEYSIASKPQTKNIFGFLERNASVNVIINFNKGNITIDFNNLTNDEKDERKEVIITELEAELCEKKKEVDTEKDPLPITGGDSLPVAARQ